MIFPSGPSRRAITWAVYIGLGVLVAPAAVAMLLGVVGMLLGFM